MNKAQQPITPDMTIGTIIEKYPQTTEVLLGYGLHCVGCAVNPYETLEQGALGHGMTKETIDSMLSEVNLVVTKKPDYLLNQDGITLSPNAVDTLQAMMEADGKSGFGLKVSATKEGKSLDYYLDIVEAAEEGEKTLEWEGIKIFIDEKSLRLMSPSVIDYQTLTNSEGFKIISLKEAEETCKCGKPLDQCGCKNGEGCACGKGGCS
jgi:iron-sulfur cluster assembly accessory protein